MRRKLIKAFFFYFFCESIKECRKVIFLKRIKLKNEIYVLKNKLKITEIYKIFAIFAL